MIISQSSVMCPKISKIGAQSDKETVLAEKLQEATEPQRRVVFEGFVMVQRIFFRNFASKS